MFTLRGSDFGVVRVSRKGIDTHRGGALRSDSLDILVSSSINCPPVAKRPVGFFLRPQK